MFQSMPKSIHTFLILAAVRVALPAQAVANSPKAIAANSASTERSVEALFVEFLKEEELKVGKAELEKMSRDVLFRKFRNWHRLRNKN